MLKRCPTDLSAAGDCRNAMIRKSEGWHMGLRLEMSLAAVLLMPYVTTHGQASDRSAARESRQARLDAHDSRMTIRPFSTLDSAPKFNAWTIGLADDTDEAGTRTFTSPFILSHRLGSVDDWWKVQVQGDGYAEIREAGVRALTGVADVRIDILKSLAFGMAGGAGVTLPTKGEIGSTAATQRAKMLLVRDIGDRWAASASATLAHANGRPVGQSAWTNVYYAELNRTLLRDQDLVFSITHIARGGVASTNDLSGEYDFLFPFGSELNSSLSLTRGITSGGRHTTIEFDLSHAF